MNRDARDVLSYAYGKVRKDFGRQPMFCEVDSHILDSISPDKAEQRNYMLRNPVNCATQSSTVYKEHHINTNRVFVANQGMNHTEGGWPKDINFEDEDATARYRRRFERDDCYVEAILNRYNQFSHYLKQNSAIEMYEMYFMGMPPADPVENFSLRVSNIYRDEDSRQIASLCWTYEDDPKLIVAYCNKKYPILGPSNTNLTCSVWDLEITQYPYANFLPPTACWQAVSSPVSPSIIIGGLEDGRVCIFDIRVQEVPVNISPSYLAHRDPVTALLYIVYRQNTDFFSGSTDGSCMWWDVRNLSLPTEVVIMSIRPPPGEIVSLVNAEGVSALQYDKSFPTRFMCGTDTGFVVSVNRRGKTQKDMMTAIFSAHLGPVKAVHRSPCTSKMFLSCGDWTAHIWSEDIHSSPIVTGISHRYKINDVAWSPLRISSYMSVCEDGKIRIWDLLRKYREPILSLQISKNPLLKIKPHDEGRLTAIGDAKGNIYLVAASKHLILSGDKDKNLMIQLYERETYREHILESRVKEIRLKQRLEEEAEIVVHEEVINDEAQLKIVEEEYKKVVLDELRLSGLPPISTGHVRSMRNR